MAYAKGIIFAFRHFRETADPFVCPVGMKNIPAAGEDLVRISLVADVPDDFIKGGVENIMNGNGKLNVPRLAPRCPGLVETISRMNWRSSSQRAGSSSISSFFRSEGLFIVAKRLPTFAFIRED